MTAPAPDRPSIARRARLRRVVRWGLLAGLAGAVLGGAALVVLYLTVRLPAMPHQPQSSTVLDAKGRVIATFSRGGVRSDVKLGQISPVVVKALIASEDRHFYHHGGVDPFGIARAFYNDVRGGQLQGGSTITQQLVKNSYLTRERSLRRKVREAVLAIKLDRRENKDQILEQYLNTVYFGRGVYGIEAASEAYFGVSAAHLQVQQAALLVGVLRAPESSEPSRHPARARRERDRVLRAMVATKDLTPAQARRAEVSPLVVRAEGSHIKLQAQISPFFVEWVRQQAVERFGAAAVYGSGLRIHTTLDLADQLYAEAAMRSVLDRPEDPQSALVALDKEGAVKAYVGGRDYKALKVDLARGRAGGGSGRQAGSTFKPFVLATALSQRIPLNTKIPGPAHLTLNPPTGPWSVSNFGGESFGPIDLAEATAHSVNTVYAQLMLQVGPAAVARTANAMGITSPLPPQPSLALGSAEVSVLDMADSYLTLAREGGHVAPHSIEKVTTATGSVVFQAPRHGGDQALEPGAANAVTHALTGVVDHGTGTAARLPRPMAGKTGTTQGYGDAWFAGYTPDLTAVVWMGYPEGPQHAMTDVHGRSVTGGSFPAQIWKRFMEKALQGIAPTPFKDPPADLLDGPTTSLPPSSTVSTTTGPTSSTTSPTVPASTVVPATTTAPVVASTTSPPPTSTTSSTEPPTTTTPPANPPP